VAKRSCATSPDQRRDGRFSPQSEFANGRPKPCPPITAVDALFTDEATQDQLLVFENRFSGISNS
jgi:hypothetical protein